MKARTKRPKAKRPPKVTPSASVFTKPVDVVQEAQRLRLIQEALAASAEEERIRLAAEVAADLQAAKPESAWARLLKYLRA